MSQFVTPGAAVLDEIANASEPVGPSVGNSTGTYRRSMILMDTHVSFAVVGSTVSCAEAVQRAVDWFQKVERCGSRFDPSSEVMQLTGQVGVPVEASPLLFEMVRFACEVARRSGGAFDPTVGYQLEQRGFNQNYRTGEVVKSSLAANKAVSYRDVVLDPTQRTIKLRKPLILDLGAVAKGLAIDLAARDLERFDSAAIDAGGDLYLHGHNPLGKPWRIGIRHPRRPTELLETIQVTNEAVCTSGDYERTTDGRPDEHHLLDPQTGKPVEGVASVTVIGPTAMLADALSTAAFVLGPRRGIALLEREQVAGLIVTPSLQRFETSNFRGYRQ
ncbi:MAG TPA: FAD:protein FMN transferase [Chloroflexota bacterium]|nr:FAD:protein FMN transferase [Chloroflexota bacterium]